MISVSGTISVYFLMSLPIVDVMQGAIPPAVNIATLSFAITSPEIYYSRVLHHRVLFVFLTNLAPQLYNGAGVVLWKDLRL